MTRKKDPRIIAQVAVGYANGKNITEIANEVGVTRQTVSSYLRSPELANAIEGTQKSLLGVLNKSVELIADVLESKSQLPQDVRARTTLMTMIVDKLGAKVMSQVPTGSETREKQTLTLEERDRLLDEIKELSTKNESGETLDVKEAQESNPTPKVDPGASQTP